MTDGTVTRVLITGVRGKTGAPLAQRLAGRDGVHVLGGSSDPLTVTIDGIRATALSWDDPSGWLAATDGVDAVFVVRPDRPDAPDLVAGVVSGLVAVARAPGPALRAGSRRKPTRPLGAAGRAAARAWPGSTPALAEHALLEPGHAGRTYTLSGRKP